MPPAAGKSGSGLLPPVKAAALRRAAWGPALKEIEVEVPKVGTVTLPKGTLRAAMWLENILGVTGVILLGGILSGIIKRD